MRKVSLVAAALALLIGACGGAVADTTTTTLATDTTVAETTTTMEDSAFPVTVEVGGTEFTIDEMPTRIVSLSPSATETLFAIGAGDQVVAVDEFSTYPKEAPITALSGFTPNIEAISEFEPDLIIVAFDPNNLISDSFSPQGIPVVSQFPAVDRSDLLAQMEQLGALTGHLSEAVALTAKIASEWDAAVRADAGGATIYIEVDPTFFAASSHSFMGAALQDLGFVNIADPADESMSGFPQLSAEAILSASPDVIIIGTDAGTTASDVAARPGWETISAVIDGRVLVLDSDLSSRWGPRFVEYVQFMAELAENLVTTP